MTQSPETATIKGESDRPILDIAVVSAMVIDSARDKIIALDWAKADISPDLAAWFFDELYTYSLRRVAGMKVFIPAVLPCTRANQQEREYIDKLPANQKLSMAHLLPARFKTGEQQDWWLTMPRSPVYPADVRATHISLLDDTVKRIKFAAHMYNEKMRRIDLTSTKPLR